MYFKQNKSSSKKLILIIKIVLLKKFQILSPINMKKQKMIFSGCIYLYTNNKLFNISGF